MPGRNEQWQPRWEAIEAILVERPIRNQGDLSKELRRRGFEVTQSSVSRDLREMGVAKVAGRYVSSRDLGGTAAAVTGLRAVAGFVSGTDTAGPNLLIVRTTSGAAQTVALAVDAERWTEVVGTVAGDDTLFVAVRGRAQQARVDAKLHALMKEHAGE